MCSIDGERLEQPLRAAALRGLALRADELFGFEAEIVTAMVHPVDATVSAFERAGLDAASRFLARESLTPPAG